MNKDKFSMRRLAMMLRINLTEGGRTLLMQTAVMVGIILLITVISSYSMFGYVYAEGYTPEGKGPYDPMWSTQLFTMLSFAVLFAALSGAQTGSVMSSKPNRLVNLMVPARQSEKFLARFIIYSVGFFAVYFGAFLLIDLGRVAIAKMLYPDYENIHWILVYLLDFSIPTLIEGTLALTLCLSVYTLGSFIWPRHPFIITSVACGVCTLAIGFIVSIVAASVFDSDYVYPHAALLDGDGFSITVTSVFSLFFYFLAYYRYRQDEVVNRW